MQCGHAYVHTINIIGWIIPPLYSGSETTSYLHKTPVRDGGQHPRAECFTFESIQEFKKSHQRKPLRRHESQT